MKPFALAFLALVAVSSSSPNPSLSVDRLNVYDSSPSFIVNLRRRRRQSRRSTSFLSIQRGGSSAFPDNGGGDDDAVDLDIGSGSDGEDDEVAKLFESDEDSVDEEEGSGDEEDDDEGQFASNEASGDGDEEEEGEEDEEEDEEVFSDGEEVEEEEDEGALQGSGLASASTAASVAPAKPAPPPAGPMMKQMAITLGTMALIKNLDLNSPSVISKARMAFVCYHVLIQLLVVYVEYVCKAKLKAKPYKGKMVDVESAWKKMLSAAVSGGAGGEAGGAKDLMSSALKTKTSVPEPEYDIQEAHKLRGSQLFPVLFMYFMHFKRGGVQPLIFQTVTGFAGLFSNPLVKAYVFGEDVERPFVNPNAMGMPPPAAGEGVIKVEEVSSSEAGKDEGKGAVEEEEDNDDEDASAEDSEEDDDEDEEEEEDSEDVE